MTATMTSYNATISAIVERVRLQTKLNYEVSLSDMTQTKIRDFLKPLVETGVRVVLRNDVTDAEGEFTRTTIMNGDYQLNLAYGKNNRKDEFPNVLFVSVTKTPEAKFRAFWAKRRLPTCLLEAAIEKINFSKPVEIVAYDSAYAWNMQRKSDSSKEGIKFIGQEPHQKSGSFLPSLPIGYVTQSNKLVITNPNEKLEKGRTYYVFH